MTIKKMLEYQKSPIQFFKNSYESGHLTHAYLLEGDEGSGTYEAATYMAMMLLCESDNKPCFRCHNCIRVEKNNHLNVTYVEPNNDLIKKEQIDELIHELKMTSLEKGAQIAIIKDADKMNSSASNALLKLLEEPAPNHYIFLITKSKNKLLDTIVSRTQVIKFNALPRKFIISSLKENGVEDNISYVLSYLTADIDEAKQMIAEGKVYELLTLSLGIEKQIALHKDPFPYFYKNSSYIKSETNKKWHRTFLDILLLINKEIVNIYNGGTSNLFSEVISLYNKDNINIEKIMHQIDVINEYQERLNYNVNLNLFYTSLMVEINK